MPAFPKGGYKMTLLNKKLTRQQTEKQNIEKKIEQEHIRATPEEQETAADVIRKISERFAQTLVEKNVEELSSEIVAAVQEECSRLQLTYEEQKRIEKTVLLTCLGHGPIEEYLQDPEVTEIVVQRWDNIVIEKGGKVYKVNAVFNNDEHLQTIIQRIVQAVGRQINLTTPIVDARLKDGSRVNATIRPVSPDGATLTIRKFNQNVLSGKDYVKLGSMSREMLYFIERCVRGKITVFVSGGTGTGKTTFLNMASQFIPKDELIITIEDTLELKLQQPNVRRMEVRLSTNKDMMQVDQKALVKAALRQRPDRIILGETRDGSIVDLISAMSTGHEGSMSTIHANSPRNMVDTRIPILYSMNKEAEFSEQSIAMQVSEAIQVIVQISRFPDGSRKITHISCVDGLTDNGRVNIKDIFLYDRKSGNFRATGFVPNKIIRRIQDRGLSFDMEIFEKKQPGQKIYAGNAVTETTSKGKEDGV